MFESCAIFKNRRTSESVNQPAFYQSVETQTPFSPLMSINNFHKDDAGVNSYTGLESISKLFFVLSTLGPAAYCLNYVYHRVTNTSVPDQFFLVPIKSRRHKTDFELSRSFNVAEKTVSDVFLPGFFLCPSSGKKLTCGHQLLLLIIFVYQILS